jgi:hypothetical protein
MQAVNKPMIIQRVIDAQGSQSELYRLANEWMAKTFVDSKEVIQYQDKNEGVIVGRGVTESKIGLANFDFWDSLTIEVKANKARATIEDIYGETTILDTKSTIKPEEMRQKEYDELETKFNLLIDDLSIYLNQKTEEW